MAGGQPVSRTVAIYIDQAAAEQSAEKLRKKIETLERTIRRGEAAGRDMTQQMNQLGQTRDRLSQVEGVISGRMTPSIRQLTAFVNQARNELLNMSRDAPGYAARFEAFRNASLRLQEVQRDIRSVEQALRDADKPGFWARMKEGFSQGMGIGGGLNVVSWIGKGISWLKNFAASAADAAAQMESLRVAYTTLLGSQSAADQMIRDLQRFAQRTPFEFKEVSNLTKQLLAYGFAQKEIIPTLERLGNVASGVGKERLPQLMLAFGQVRAAGRLMGQELLQFVNAGFNPLINISEKTGKSMLSLRKDMANGLVSFDMVQDAFKSATSEGGKFFNLMANQNKTTSGAIAAMKDGWQQFITVLGGATNEALRNVYLMLGGIVKFVTEWISLDPAQQIEREKNELNGMVYALMNVNSNQALKSQLISEIKAKYPEFLSFIDAEKASVQDLGKALAIVNQQYDHKIRLAALEQRQQRNTDNRMDLQNAYLDAQQKLADRLKVDVVALTKMSQQERQALIKQRVQEELAKSKDKDWLDKMLSGAGGGEGSRGIKITDEHLLKQYATLEEDFTRKQTALDNERLKLTEQIGAENERQLNQDKESLKVAEQKVVEMEKNKKAIIAANGLIYNDAKVAAAVYANDLANAKKLAEGLKNVLNPVEKVKPVGEDPEDPKAKRAREKAEREHNKAVKDVADLQFKLDELKKEVAAASLDADAGFEDKANAEIQKVATKYEKLIKEVKDRLMVAAGLTPTERAALSNMIREYADLQVRETDITKKKQEKESDKDSYAKELQIISDYYKQQRQLVDKEYSAGLISKEQYKEKVRALELDEAAMRVDIIQGFAPYVEKAAEDLEKAKTDALKKGIADRDALAASEQRRQEALLQVNILRATKGSKAEYNAKIAALKYQYQKEREAKKGNTEAVKLLDEQEKQELKVLEREYWKQKADMILQVLNGIGQLFSSFMNALNQGDENRLNQEKAENDEKKKSYQKMLDGKQISQEQYDRYIADADAEMEKKELEVKKKKAKRDKAAALFSAVINTASGVASALTTQPVWLGIAMAAIVGAMGAMEIATIANQKEPQFKDGGIFNTTGGIAKGPSHARGGIGMYDEQTGHKVGEMEGDESYMILSKKTTAANRDIIEKLLSSSMSGSGDRIAPDWMYEPTRQLDFGDAIETMEYTRHYRNGGVTQPAAIAIQKATAGSSPSDQQILRDISGTLQKLDKKLDQPLRAFVPWTDLETKRKQYELLQKTASFSPAT